MRHNKGFTLIELSIVVVIIGLIVAGVVAGQSLVRQAKMRAVLSDVNKFRQMLGAFKLQYNAIPGDFNNAFAYWGTNCASTDLICNGNGDGIVKYWNGGNDQHESIHAWRHLELAGLANYSLDITVPGAYGHKPTNSPGSTFSNTLWHIISSSICSGINGFCLMLGADAPTNNLAMYQYFTPAEALGLDTKSDDGLRASGSTRAVGGWVSYSVSSTNCDDSTASGYELSYANISCIMVFSR